LLLEVGINQSERVSNIISQTGKFSPPEILKDLSNVERVVKAYKL
jgi:methylase of polypeptide subunit release factors